MPLPPTHSFFTIMLSPTLTSLFSVSFLIIIFFLLRTLLDPLNIAVDFNRVGNEFRYQLWYNQTATGNETLNVEEMYGDILVSVMRGLDEAIRIIISFYLLIPSKIKIK